MAEYPRPHFDRSHSWLSLDGEWDFSFTEPVYDRRITVPYAWETRASGIAEFWQPVGWYRRPLDVPSEWNGQRVVLHFGAAHHLTTVWVNGIEVVRHEGGYTPFEADITDALASGNGAELVVRVDAPADKREIAHGKQRSVPRTDYDGVCFTPSSGIWQSVWLESRPATHIGSLSLRPTENLDGISVRVKVAGPNAAGATLKVDGIAATADPTGAAEIELPIAEPRLWSPSDPHLYSVRVELETADGVDRVSGYTGLRKVEVRGEEILLNGERLYVKGVLDQGYWPETGITPPGDEAMIRDLELARELGYTLVRKHLKLEDPRFIHHADRLGMLLWCEPASTGTFTEASTAAFEAQIEPMVRRDGNSPAIVIWGLYNEEWGLDWDIPGDAAKQEAVVTAYGKLASLDRSRPIVDNSGWTHVRTDLLDWHYYDESAIGWARTLRALVEGERDDFPVKLGPDFVVHKALAVPSQPLRGLPNLNSEYGGGFTSVERGWHLRWQTQELRRHDRLSGYVYTELYDIEHESAGLLTFDRQPKDLGGASPVDANATTTLVLDVEPVAPGRDILGPDAQFGVHVSHHGPELFAGTLTWAWGPIYSTAPLLGAVDGPAVEAKPYELSAAVAVAAVLPDGWSSGRLHLTAVTADGRVAARATVDVDRSTTPHIGDDKLVSR
ncbi:glycoside hydrolase family 2 [Actinoplanes sp. LDG1-06]|uniref:Glycoside hydrolase family 2 n=1 Tax=Paractinoplanes ovalisporus TaxID=2810368 RepID=A0ABS2A7K6_9ACTN|nr:sugar-binding domain-containing protein [Actinoplanes ovalisporus]MBM2615817.1 glycoside hydrolase family 2 [Actinoplanes ovalisporus]